MLEGARRSGEKFFSEPKNVKLAIDWTMFGLGFFLLPLYKNKGLDVEPVLKMLSDIIRKYGGDASDETRSLALPPQTMMARASLKVDEAKLRETIAKRRSVKIT